MITVASEILEKMISELESGAWTSDQCVTTLKDLGTPIIEEREGYSRFVWVTHVYVPETPVENVVVYERNVEFNPERAIMNRIEGTNIFWKTTIVPYDVVVEYGFSVNDSFDPQCVERTQRLLRDPFNKLDGAQGAYGLSAVKTPAKP